MDAATIIYRYTITRRTTTRVGILYIIRGLASKQAAHAVL